MFQTTNQNLNLFVTPPISRSTSLLVLDYRKIQKVVCDPACLVKLKVLHNVMFHQAERNCDTTFYTDRIFPYNPSFTDVEVVHGASTSFNCWIWPWYVSTVTMVGAPMRRSRRWHGRDSEPRLGTPNRLYVYEPYRRNWVSHGLTWFNHMSHNETNDDGG